LWLLLLLACQVIHKGGAFTNAFPLAAKSSADGRREHRMVLVLEEVRAAPY
jgi:hypothetical protein